MAAPMPVPEVQAYTAPNSSEEEQQASLDTLVSRMRAGTPSPRDLVSLLGTSQRWCMSFAHTQRAVLRVQHGHTMLYVKQRAETKY